MVVHLESVAAGHPDKLCDAISDAIVDACLALDPKAKVAVETLVKDVKIDRTSCWPVRSSSPRESRLPNTSPSPARPTDIGYVDRIGMDATSEERCEVLRSSQPIRTHQPRRGSIH